MGAAAAEPGLRFDAVFRTPLSAAGAADGVAVDAILRITNRGARPARIARVGSAQPELLDASGHVVPFSGGTNLARVPRPGDEVDIPPGGTLDIPVAGRLRRRDGRLEWSGADGLMGDWTLRPRAGPYALRLRYQPVIRRPELWSGPGVTAASPLPF